ncbi:MAG: DUF2934 domain-containing protein [Gammaproteobacteria bacterium]|nr:DUF2934 domain-containing protein [Gammaproteobacteria bacterium]
MCPAPKTEKKTASKKKAVSKKKVALKKSPAKKKVAVKKSVTKKRVVKKKSVASKKAHPQVSPRERYEMIATMAYYRAEKRNFEQGHDYQDWLECEAIVDKMLSK